MNYALLVEKKIWHFLALKKSMLSYHDISENINYVRLIFNQFFKKYHTWN